MIVANMIASRHIKDYFVRARFKNEVKQVVANNLDIIRKAGNEAECRRAIDNIKVECANLERQETMLSLRQAKVFITISMEKYNKELGNTIDAIGVGLGLTQIYGGIGVLAKAGYMLGKFAGSYIILSGANSAVAHLLNILSNDDNNSFLERKYSCC